jgi:RHO1 GDP-GTP exchange protein 1/2
LQTAIHTQIKRELTWNHGGRANANDRRVALHVARSLQSQLFFYEVEWGSRKLQDGVEDVYMLMDDQESNSDTPPDREELPTSVVTVLTRCYSPMCEAGEVWLCYAYNCPNKVRVDTLFKGASWLANPILTAWLPPPHAL